MNKKIWLLPVTLVIILLLMIVIKHKYMVVNICLYEDSKTSGFKQTILVKRIIQREKDQEELLNLCLKELYKGPTYNETKKGIYTCIPKDTHVKIVKLEKTELNINEQQRSYIYAYVDLPKELIDRNNNDLNERRCFQICGTLGSNADIVAVLTIDGTPAGRIVNGLGEVKGANYDINKSTQ